MSDFLPAVTVIWIDAFNESKWLPIKDGAKLKPEATYTRGYLVDEKNEDDCTVICRDYVPMEQEGYDPMGDGYIAIPNRCILSIDREG